MGKALRACSRRTDSAVTGYSGGIPLYNTGGISLVFKKNGKDDGGLLERELDFCEADIDTVLDLQNEEDLEKGLFCFAYCDPFTIGFYMKLSSMDDNPSVVTDWEEKKCRKLCKSICSRGRFICIRIALHMEM